MQVQGVEVGSDQDAPFAIGWLSTEVLAGITQRLSKRAKVEVERVDGRLAAVTRALGWRHYRSLALHVDFRPDAPLLLRAGDLTVELSGSSTNAAAVARFFIQRARVAELKVVSQLPDGNKALSHNGQADKQAVMRAMATVLSAPSIQLRVLSLEGTATELFGSPAPAAALFRCHAASLEQAALGLRHGAESAELYSAVRACTGLRSFTGRLQLFSPDCRYYVVEASSAISALFGGWALHSCAITLASSPCPAVGALASFPPMPHVKELHMLNVFAWNAKKIMPELQVLRLVSNAAACGYHPLFMCDYYIYAFFKRADVNLSLSIEVVVVVRPFHENWLSCLRRCCEMLGLSDVHMECFDAAVCAEEGVALSAAPPPPLPPQFEHNGESVVFRLQRHGENRHLVLALFAQTEPIDDDDG